MFYFKWSFIFLFGFNFHLLDVLLQITGSNNRWDCESVGFYRSLNAGCADFSFDGTALAIGFEHLITLWDPDNMTVHATLTNNLSNRPAVR